jgi:hypothetical protein
MLPGLPAFRVALEWAIGQDRADAQFPLTFGTRSLVKEDTMKRMLIVALLSMGLALTMAATATAAYQTDITAAEIAAGTQGVGTWVSVYALPSDGTDAGGSLGPAHLSYADAGVVCATDGTNFDATVPTGLNNNAHFEFYSPVTLSQLVAVTITGTLTNSTGGAGTDSGNVNLTILSYAGSGGYVTYEVGGTEVYSGTDTVTFSVSPADIAAFKATPDGIIDSSAPILVQLNNIGDGSANTFSFAEVALTTTTPEPISMIFFGTGLVAVGGYMARRKMARKA